MHDIEAIPTALPVDHGDHAGVHTPWDDPAWRARALEWAGRSLAAHGLRTAGQPTVRIRPWSVLVRIPLAGDPKAAWFKANPPASAFEAGLGSALARMAPAHVLHPLAVDAAEGWALLPDGGSLFADALATGRDDPQAWEAPLRQYAAFQREVAGHLPELAALGVPDGCAAALPALLERLLDETAALSPAERTTLLPRFTDWCEELAATGIADSLDHADLHGAQILGPDPASGRFTFFDWGDAQLAHPFCSLLVPSRVIDARFGPDAMPRLRDAYLEPWTGDGRTPAELRRAVRLACRIGAVGRAHSWGRLFPQPDADAAAGGPADTSANAAQWLRRLLVEPAG